MVHTPEGDIIVLGAFFVVRTCEGEVRATVLRGSVRGAADRGLFSARRNRVTAGVNQEIVLKEVPAALSLQTKAERGFAMLQGGPPRPRYAEPVALAAATRVGEAFQTTGWTCLRHLALNQEAVDAGDVLGVLQMRVGVERLSAIIAFFARLLDGPETDAIKSEIEWLAGELEPVCAFYAFLNRTLYPLGNWDWPTDIPLPFPPRQEWASLGRSANFAERLGRYNHTVATLLA